MSIIPATLLLSPFDLIEKVYGSELQATEDQKKEIERSLAEYDLTGRVCIGGGAIGIIVSYFAWKIPYIGPVFGIIVGGASIASSILGYDILQCGKNLTTFVKDEENKNKIFQTVEKFKQKLTGQEENNFQSEEKFRQKLVDQAVKSTLVFKGFLSYAIINRKIS